MEDAIFRIRSAESGLMEISMAAYKKVRNKILYRLRQFYSEVTFRDADFTTSDILYYCAINGNLIIKKFDAIDWVNHDASGEFNEKYREFTKSGKTTSVDFGELVGKGDPTKYSFRRKRLS